MININSENNEDEFFVDDFTTLKVSSILNKEHYIIEFDLGDINTGPLQSELILPEPIPI